MHMGDTGTVSTQSKLAHYAEIDGHACRCNHPDWRGLDGDAQADLEPFSLAER